MGQTLFFFFCNTFCAGKGSKAWNWSNVNPSQPSTLSSCGGYSVLLRTLLSLLLLFTTDMCLCNTTISIAAWCWPRRRFRLVVGTRTNHEFPYRSSARQQQHPANGQLEYTPFSPLYSACPHRLIILRMEKGSRSHGRRVHLPFASDLLLLVLLRSLVLLLRLPAFSFSSGSGSNSD